VLWPIWLFVVHAIGRSCVQPVDIPAVVDLPEIVKVPECQRIKVFDLGVPLERQGEDIADCVQRRVRLGLERGGLVIVKALPLFFILDLEQRGAMLLDDG
jgi:hypothetical protein